MTVPGFQDCMRPALDLLHVQGTLRSREVKDKLADHFDLSERNGLRCCPAVGNVSLTTGLRGR